MTEQGPPALTAKDFENALKDMGTYIDVTVEDLLEITTRAQGHARLRESESVAVQAFMSRSVHSVHPTTQLSQAAHLLVEHRISGLPVVDAEGRLEGLITEADFLRAIGLPARQPTHHLWQTLEEMFSRSAPPPTPRGDVSGLMVREVITVRPDQRLEDAVDLMKQHRIKRLVVVDDGRRVLGMVTRSDLVRVFFDRFKSAEE